MSEKITSENYLTIQGWQVKELGLKGNELLIYAIIYGFTQDGEQLFYGGIQYLQEWTNSTRQGVYKALDALIEKGLVEKVVSPESVNKVYYRVNKVDRRCKQSLQTPTECVNKVDRYNINTIRSIIEKYNSICVSFAKVTALSGDRQKHIGARLKQYSIEQIETVFRKAEASSFLKGKNNRGWKANFDWLLNETNFAKVLDGNYDDKHGNGAGGDTGDSLKPSTGQNINYDNYRRTGV